MSCFYVFESGPFCVDNVACSFYLHVTCYSMKRHNCIPYEHGHRVKSGVCAWYCLFTILDECVVSLEIGTTSKIETHRCIR